jgi:tRNA pseudouridine38-40 synthase
MNYRTIRLLIAYDGTDYQGWQRQPQAPTIQGTIEAVVRKITREPVTLLGAGRTDAGVHAWGQVAHFDTSAALVLEKWQGVFNALLPPDIRVRAVQEATPDFHARYASRMKIYDYYLLNAAWPAPFYHRYSWWIGQPLDFKLMIRGLAGIEGQHDFSAYQTAGSDVRQTVRTLFRADLTRLRRGGVRLRFQADGFLRHMVRNLVGALIRLGMNKISLGDWQDILVSRDRSRAGAMAPARGLFLRKVIY